MSPHLPISIDVADGTDASCARASGASADRVALWQVERERWSPRTFTARDGSGRVLGAALTAGRPLTAYRKVVDVIATDDSVFVALVEAVIGDERSPDEWHPTPLVLHFEEHLGLAPLTEDRRAALDDLGFQEARQPVPSIPSTRADAAGRVAAWSRWTTERTPRLAPYYGQTTEVTCGAVSALMALERRGAEQFDPARLEENRATELGFWRRATNLPACEPIGLAVATARSGTELDVAGDVPRVWLSARGPVLLEDFAAEEAERALRIDLQNESLREAEQLGIAVDRRWIEVDEIAALVRDGYDVLLLIGLTDLIGDPTPHWVLATDVLDDAIIISDPWVQYPNGETWVDTFALPIPFAGIDRITRWGDPAYRGVVGLPASARRAD